MKEAFGFAPNDVQWSLLLFSAFAVPNVLYMIISLQFSLKNLT